MTTKAQVENARADAWADLANWMWTIICNVSEGDWTKQSEVWQDAAADCREQYHTLLSSETPVETEDE